MSNQRRFAIAGGFYVVWLGILYSGADHPPPIGFLWVVLLCLIAAVLVYVRVPTYASWSAARSRFRLVRVIIDGAAAGLVFALVTSVFNSGGELSIQFTWIDYGIWFVVLAVVGAANAILIYFVGLLFNRTVKR